MRKQSGFSMLAVSLIVLGVFLIVGVGFYGFKATKTRVQNDVYDGFIISMNPSQNEFLLSLSCTKLDQWLPMCVEANPAKWNLWRRFLNLFQDPLLITVITDNTAVNYGDYPINFNFFELKPHIFVSVEGYLNGEFLGFKKGKILATEINIPYLETRWGRSNRIISIEKDTKNSKVNILNLKSTSGSRSFDIKAYVSENTLIVDKDGNQISLDNLSLNTDIISVWSRKYIGVNYGESIKTIELVAEKIILLGQATGEGEKIKTISKGPDYKSYERDYEPDELGELSCQEGLTKIGVSNTENFYCTKCGDGICKSPETTSICPNDCLKAGDNFDYIVNFDDKSFNPNKKTFIGDISMSGIEAGGIKGIKVIVSDTAKIYSWEVNSPQHEKHFMSLSKIISLSSSSLSWHNSVEIRGVVLSYEKGEMTVRADEILFPLQ